MNRKMLQLLTPSDIAEMLQISEKTVYKHKQKFCGFYPAGLKVLRFSKEVVDDIIQNSARVEVSFPEERAAAHRVGVLPEKGCSKGRGGKKKRKEKNVHRHGL